MYFQDLFYSIVTLSLFFTLFKMKTRFFISVMHWVRQNKPFKFLSCSFNFNLYHHNYLFNKIIWLRFKIKLKQRWVSSCELICVKRNPYCYQQYHFWHHFLSILYYYNGIFSSDNVGQIIITKYLVWSC